MDQYNLIQQGLEQALLWVQSLGAIGVLAYLLIYSLATVLLVPGSVLTLGSGAIYGWLWGSIYAFVAATLGSICAFLVGRYLIQDWVNQKIQGNARFQAIAAAIAKDGFRVVVLTRLSPVFPFTLLNYAFGVTPVFFKDYVLGSIGMIPGTVMYVYLGSLAGDLARLGVHQDLNPQAEALQWGVRVLGLIATITVTLYLTRMAREALNQGIDGGESHDPARDK